MAKRKPSRGPRNNNGLLLTILLLLLVGVGVLVYFLFFRPVPFPQDSVTFETQSENASIVPTPNGLIVVDGTVLTRKDASFKDLWSIDLPEADSHAAASESLTAVWSSQRVIVFNSAGTLLQHMSPPGRVETMACGSDSFAMLCEEDGQRNIYIYKAVSGNLTQKIQFPDQTVNAIGFFGENSTYLWAAVTDVFYNQVTSHLKVFQPGQSLLVTITVSNDVITACYAGTNTLYLVGTDNIYLYDLAGNLIQQTGVYGWELLDGACSGSALELVLAPAGLTGESAPLGRLRYVKMDGSTVTDNAFDVSSGIRWAALEIGEIIAADQAGYEILSFTGKVKSSMIAPQPIGELISIESIHALVARQDNGVFSCMLPEE